MGDLKINRPIIPISKTTEISNRNIKSQNINGNFNSILQQEVSRQAELKFSKHAIERLETRNISLTKQELQKINDAVNKAAQKGVKDTLIIMGNTAFIANVKSKTVVTAATGDNLKDNIFTNIDGAVII